MSYTLTIGCGCLVYVASHPRTKIVHTRIIERRGGECRVLAHDIGVRLQLWELLPDPEPARIAGVHMTMCGAATERRRAS